MRAHLAHDGNFLQELLELAGIILQLLQDLHSHLLPAVVAAVQVAEAAGCHLQGNFARNTKGTNKDSALNCMHGWRWMLACNTNSTVSEHYCKSSW
jgi:hypothetical protein